MVVAIEQSGFVTQEVSGKGWVFFAQTWDGDPSYLELPYNWENAAERDITPFPVARIEQRNFDQAHLIEEMKKPETAAEFVILAFAQVEQVLPDMGHIRHNDVIIFIPPDQGRNLIQWRVVKNGYVINGIIRAVSTTDVPEVVVYMMDTLPLN